MKLAESLSDSAVKSLTVNGNRLFMQGAESFSQAVQQSKTLEFFDIRDCYIGILGVEKIADMITNSQHLKTLKMSRNDLNDKGAITIADALWDNKVLGMVDLSSNEIGKKGAQHLAAILHTSELIMKRRGCGRASRCSR